MSSQAPVRPGGASWSLGWRLGCGRLGRLRLVALVLLVLAGLAPPAYLVQTGGVLATGYTIQRLRAERNSWRVRNQQLELELAKVRSLGWIENDAVSRLGMQRPTQQTIVRVDTPPPPPRHAPTAIDLRATTPTSASTRPPIPPATSARP